MARRGPPKLNPIAPGLTRDLVQPNVEVVKDYRVHFERFLKLKEGTPAQETNSNWLTSHYRDWAANCVWITNKQRKRQLFHYNRSQTEFFNLIEEKQISKGLPVRAIIVKPRRKGKTAGIASFFLNRVLYQKYTHAAVMAHTVPIAQQIFRRYYQGFYKSLPDDMKPTVDVGSREARMLFFKETESSIRVLSQSEKKSGDDVGSTGRGDEFHLLHLTEVPQYNNPMATTNALKDCVPAFHPGTAIIYESTAKAYGDFFFNEWENACKGKSDYLPFFIPWFIDDEYALPFENEREKETFRASLGQNDDDVYGNECGLWDAYPLTQTYPLTLEHLKWRRAMIREKQNNLALFEREYPGSAEEAFQRAGGNWLNPKVMRVYLSRCTPPLRVGDFMLPEVPGSQPVFTDRHQGWVKIWKEADPYAEYVIGTDTSGQGENDNSAIVLERATDAIVAEVAGYEQLKLMPTTFAKQVLFTGKYYNEAWINPEANYGIHIIETLRELGYRKLVRANQLRVGDGPFSQHPTKVGWWNSRSVRVKLQALLKEWFEGEWVWGKLENLKDVPNQWLIEEAMAMILDADGRAVAPMKGKERQANDAGIGYNDDRVFALFGAIFADEALPLAMHPELRKEQRERESQKKWMSELGLFEDNRERRYAGLVPSSYLRGLPKSALRQGHN